MKQPIIVPSPPKAWQKHAPCFPMQHVVGERNYGILKRSVRAGRLARCVSHPVAPHPRITLRQSTSLNAALAKQTGNAPNRACRGRAGPVVAL